MRNFSQSAPLLRKLKILDIFSLTPFNIAQFAHRLLFDVSKKQITSERTSAAHKKTNNFVSKTKIMELASTISHQSMFLKVFHKKTFLSHSSKANLVCV